jgi:hypothetical protein
MHMSRSLAILLLAPMLLVAQPQRLAAQECSSMGSASERRTEALRAVRMFNSAAVAERGSPLLPRLPRRPQPPYPAWSDLATSGMVGMWRTDGGPTGDLARKIRWGDDEPLAGWQIHWIANADGYAFTLTDVRDRCGFSYSSDERGVILQGVNLQPRYSVIPAETQ